MIKHLLFLSPNTQISTRSTWLYHVKRIVIICMLTIICRTSYGQCFDMTTLDADGTMCSCADHAFEYIDNYTSWYSWIWTKNVREDFGISTTQYSNKYGVSNWNASRQTIITTSMLDPQQNAISTLPPNKQSCIRLGNPRAGGVGMRPFSRDDYRYSSWHLQAEAIQFEFKVENEILDFQYAALVDRTYHTLTGDYHGAQPRIEVFFTDIYGNKLNVNSLAFSCWGDNSLSSINRQKDGWKTAYRNGYMPYYWKDWTTVGFNLSNYMGQTIQLHIENYDCVVEGQTSNFTYCDKHYSYLYFFLDCAEKKIEEECLPQQKVRLTAPEGFYYRWYVRETGESLGSNREIVTKADGTKTYCCECSQKEDMTGSFTLTTKPKCDPEVFITKTICKGDSYPFNGQDLTEPGEYVHIDHLSSTMDSTTHLTLIVQEALDMPIEKQIICEGDAYDWKGHSTKYQSITEAGDYFDTLRYTTGCDSVRYHLQLSKITTIQTTDIVNTCQQQLKNGGFFWHDEHIISPDQSGSIWSTQSITGCDSIVTLDLHIEETPYEYDTVILETFKPFEWRGRMISKRPSGDSVKLEIKGTCPSYAVLHIIIAPHYFEHVDTCRDELPFQWHGHEIRGMEDDSLRIKEVVDGKDVYYTLCLHVHDSYVQTITDTICSGDTIYLGEEPFTTTGTYTRKLTSTFGCDSIVTLKLLVQNPPKERIERKDICEGEEYTWNDKKAHLSNLTTTGVYRDTLFYTTDCDSIYKILKLYVHAPQTKFITIKDTICKGNSLHFYDSIFSTPGIHDAHLITPFGCDSIIRLDLFVGDAVYDTVYGSFCEGSSYKWRNKTYSTPGKYNDTLISSLECDSITTLVLEQGTEYRHTLDTTICEGDSIRYADSVFATPDTFVRYIRHPNSCDSVMTLILKVNKHSVPQDTIVTRCDSFIWHGTKYTTSGRYPITLTNKAGCDSVVTLDLTINHPSVPQDTSAIACDSFIWHGTKYTTSGRYPITLTNKAGCDSVVTLDLTINHPSVPQDTIATACDSFVWRGTKYTTSGRYPITLTNKAGCDSVVTLDLTINHPSVPQDTFVTRCDSFIWRGTKYTTSGKYPITLTNKAGCDSVVTLDLTINATTKGDTTATACDSFTWRGTKYTTSGKYPMTLTNKAGCDSVVTLDLTINYPSVPQDTIATACDSFIWYGTKYTTSGRYPITLINKGGCDSVVTLDLTINHPSVPQDTSATACDSFVWRGTKYTTSGKYPMTLSNKAGCDSIVTLDLTIYSSVTTEDGDTVCLSELPYTWRDKGEDIETFTVSDWQEEKLVRKHTFSTVHHCDSIVTFTLVVQAPTNAPEEVAAFTPDHPYTWKGHEIKFPAITEEGTYHDTAYYTTGCDSMFYTLILSHHHPEVVGALLVDTLCGDEKSLPVTFVKQDGYPTTYSILFSGDAHRYFRDTTDCAFPDKDTLIHLVPIVLSDEDYVRPDNYQLTLTVKDALDRITSYSSSFTVLYPSSILTQRWNDVLMLNNEHYNGNYTFSQIEWYHNGAYIQGAGEHNSYIYEPAGLAMGERYWAVLTRDDDGKTFRTCDFLPIPQNENTTFATYVQVAPRHHDNWRQLQVLTNISGSYIIFDLAGRRIQTGQFGDNYGAPDILLPAAGCFVLQFHGDEGTRTTTKWIAR